MSAIQNRDLRSEKKPWGTAEAYTYGWLKQEVLLSAFGSCRRRSGLSKAERALRCNRLKLWSPFLMQETVRKYHRQSRRVTITQPVRLCPAGQSGQFFEEIGATENISREGFYFLIHRDYYLEGMRLFVTLPYHFPRHRGDREYIGQVVRVKLLGDGQRGVAVQLLSSVGGPQ